MTDKIEAARAVLAALGVTAEDLLASDAGEGGGEKNGAYVLDADGWRIWSGGECPVDEDVDVVVMQRDGVEVTEAAGILSWDHEGAWYDIVAYRVGQEAPAAEKRDEPWRPGHGEKYYFIGDDWCIFSTKFYDCYPRENACVTAGNCFRTREEAEAKRAEIFS